MLRSKFVLRMLTYILVENWHSTVCIIIAIHNGTDSCLANIILYSFYLIIKIESFLRSSILIS